MVYLDSCSAKSFFLHIQLAGMAAYLHDALYSLMKGFLALSHSKFGRVALLLLFSQRNYLKIILSRYLTLTLVMCFFNPYLTFFLFFLFVKFSILKTTDQDPGDVL